MRTLIALAALALAAPAFAQSGNASDFEWSKVTTPDGKVTARIPCSKDQVKIEMVGADGYKIECVIDGARWVMVSGLQSNTKSDEGRVNGFDTLYERSNTGSLKPYIKLTKLGDRRKLTIACDIPDSAMCMVVIDMAPKAPLAVGFAGDLQAYKDLPAERRKAIFNASAEFVGSLELTGK
jgi:hypothetical protein